MFFISPEGEGEKGGEEDLFITISFISFVSFHTVYCIPYTVYRICRQTVEIHTSQSVSQSPIPTFLTHRSISHPTFPSSVSLHAYHTHLISTSSMPKASQYQRYAQSHTSMPRLISHLHLHPPSPHQSIDFTQHSNQFTHFNRPIFIPLLTQPPEGREQRITYGTSLNARKYKVRTTRVPATSSVRGSIRSQELAIPYAQPCISLDVHFTDTTLISYQCFE